MRKAALVVFGLFLAGFALPVSAQDAATPAASPAAWATIAATPVDGTLTFTVIERAETDAVIEQAPEGDSAGDILVFANPVFDENDDQQVGTDQGWCIRTDPAAGAWECTWTLFLSQGQIVAQGPFFDTAPSTMAITGGTGDFSEARGELELSAASDTSFAFTYVVSVD